MRLHLVLGMIAPICSCMAAPEHEGTGAAVSQAFTAGSSLNSPHADPGKAYFAKRKIAILDQVGALSAAARDLALRVDGVIANQPADGHIGLAELLRYDEPDMAASLLPAETAALPILWRLLEVDLDVASDEADTFSAEHQPRIVVPVQPAFDPDRAEPIAELAAAHQILATRAAAVGGAPAGSVRFSDVRRALRDSAPYTPTERASLPALLDEVVARQLPEDTIPRIQIPPKETAAPPIALGAGRLDIRLTTKLIRGGVFPPNGYALDRDKTGVEQMARGTLTTAADERVIAVPQGCPESILSASSPYVCAGVAVLEVWAGGVRTDQVRLNLPIGIGSALSDHFSTLDLPIDAGGEVFSDCSYQQQNNGQLLVCADRRERVALDRPSWLPLAPGRYALGHVLHDFGPGQSMWLEVYARSVVRFVVGTAVDAPTARVGFPMTRMATPPRHWFALSDPQGPYASFWVDSDLEAQGWGASVEVRITPEMREGL